jgi:hypothetical protein
MDNPTRYVVTGYGSLLDYHGLGLYIGVADTKAGAVSLAEAEITAHPGWYQRVAVVRSSAAESTPVWIYFTKPVGERADLGAFAD